jgi:hypothetical protein
VGCFEGIRSERGIAWRCSDSRSLRSFLGVALGESTPEHSTLSRTRKRFSEHLHQQVFDWVLARPDKKRKNKVPPVATAQTLFAAVPQRS